VQLLSFIDRLQFRAEFLNSLGRKGNLSFLTGLNCQFGAELSSLAASDEGLVFRYQVHAARLEVDRSNRSTIFLSQSFWALLMRSTHLRKRVHLQEQAPADEDFSGSINEILTIQEVLLESHPVQ
jgi:hypothetical protein